MSVELSVATTAFMNEPWTFIDCPGSVEFALEAQTALMVADAAIVVCEPVAERVLMLAPLLKFLDDRQIPHLIFINKIDQSSQRVRDVLSALQAISTRPLVLRQVPIREGDTIGGYVDLVSERAYHYKPGHASDLIPIPEGTITREKEARQTLLEKLADFDDKLLEQLLEDIAPSKEEIYRHLTQNLASDRVVPVLIGSADRDHGVRRLSKALRHEVPDAPVTMARLGLPADGEPLLQIFKTQYAAHTGKLSYARIWRGPLADGTTLGDGKATARISGIGKPLGIQQTKLAKAEAGDVVSLGRLESIPTGATLTPSGKIPPGVSDWPRALTPLFALALEPEKRADDVKLSGALHRLTEEDPSLSVEHNPDTGEMLLWGQGEIHVAVALDRLKSQYNVAVIGRTPQVPYKETIRRAVTQHARHKRQSGGHGQFADVKVDIKPVPRGAGFAFEDRIVGGAIPRNFIPAVEEGVIDSLKRGTLGFPVVDLHVALTDGQYHAVDPPTRRSRRRAASPCAKLCRNASPCCWSRSARLRSPCPTSSPQGPAPDLDAPRPHPGLRRAGRLDRLGHGGRAPAAGGDARPDHRAALGDHGCGQLRLDVRPSGRAHRQARREGDQPHGRGAAPLPDRFPRMTPRPKSANNR